MHFLSDIQLLFSFVTEPEADVFDHNDDNDDIRVPASLRCSIIHIFSDEWFKEMLGENFLITRRGICSVRLKVCFLQVFDIISIFT